MPPAAIEIRRCEPSDFDEICAIVNDAASAYRDIIPSDRWKEPYMPLEELQREVADGVVFWGARETGDLVAVMGLQFVLDVALIRHAYTRTARRGAGFGTTLVTHLQRMADRPMLVGTWKAATWAVSFYERRGFRLVTPEQKDALLRKYWTVPERQIEESVVLADKRWFTMSGSQAP